MCLMSQVISFFKSRSVFSKYIYFQSTQKDILSQNQKAAENIPGITFIVLFQIKCNTLYLEYHKQNIRAKSSVSFILKKSGSIIQEIEFAIKYKLQKKNYIISSRSKKKVFITQGFYLNSFFKQLSKKNLMYQNSIFCKRTILYNFVFRITHKILCK